MSTKRKNSLSQRSLVKYRKEVNKLLDIANDKKEAEFQTHTQYIEFKKKKIMDKKEFHEFVNGLDKIDFHEECIFWYKR